MARVTKSPTSPLSSSNSLSELNNNNNYGSTGRSTQHKQQRNSSMNSNNSNSNSRRRDSSIIQNIWISIKGWLYNWPATKIAGLLMIVLLASIVIYDYIIRQDEEEEIRDTQIQVQQQEEWADNGYKKVVHSPTIPMPSGVNFGSWLSLEDYFFASIEAVEVATPGFGPYKVAACLPPLHVGLHTGPKWYSETDLFSNMTIQSKNIVHTIEVFQAHRTNYIDFEIDLQRLVTLGITSIRVPMSWCLTDDDPRNMDLKSMSESELQSKFTCIDPYFNDTNDQVVWPAVPKPFVEDFLRACHRHGIKATLDIHTYPGGTSIGTFSGVWPRWPRYWTYGDIQSTDLHKSTNPGHVIFQGIVDWIESLSESDPDAFNGLRGLSPMNEPAHLAGLFGGYHPKKENFLPPLPDKIAQEYIQELDSTKGNPVSQSTIPNGTHLRVFYWFRGAIDIFRNSKLPGLGKELHANIHESILSEDYLPTSVSSEDNEAAAIRTIASWWCSTNTTTINERTNWAILDMHHYHSWSIECMGSVDGQDAAYACDDYEKRDEVLTRCTQWASMFRQIVNEECGSGTRLMSAEFSASSHHNVRKACNSISNLRESYVRQVETAREANVELFYWSYHMPYGGAFRRAWSFQHLMYLLGVVDRPDEPQFECNGHIPDEQEPNDDVWLQQNDNDGTT